MNIEVVWMDYVDQCFSTFLNSHTVPFSSKKFGATLTCQKWLSEAPEALDHKWKKVIIFFRLNPWNLLTASPGLGTSVVEYIWDSDKLNLNDDLILGLNQVFAAASKVVKSDQK